MEAQKRRQTDSLSTFRQIVRAKLSHPAFLLRKHRLSWERESLLTHQAGALARALRLHTKSRHPCRNALLHRSQNAPLPSATRSSPIRGLATHDAAQWRARTIGWSKESRPASHTF